MLNCRFRWVYCQFTLLRKCISTKDIQRALNKLPKSLEETYTRILEEIDDDNWKYVHIIFQCVAAASRPLRVDELSQFLAFDFEAGSTPMFHADELLGDPVDTVLSMCSSLIAAVKPGSFQRFKVVQFAHFTVKEYLTSTWLAETKDTISRFHISMTPAHTTVAQGCLGLLLHIDETVTRSSLENFPLAKYAAQHWMDHARIEDISSKVEDGMKRLFDPNKSHFSVSIWIHDPGYRYRFSLCYRPQSRSERPGKPRVTNLHYATFHGLHDVVQFLIVEYSQDVNARGLFDEETPLHVASYRGHANIAQLLLGHGADKDARDHDSSGRTPLHLSSYEGHVEVVRILLEQGANANAVDRLGKSPLQYALIEGHVEAARALLQHGADMKHKDRSNCTILHVAIGEEGTRFLLKYGADANALTNNGRTPLHSLSSMGCLEAAQVLLEHGVDANAQDADNATPLHLASGFNPIEKSSDHFGVVRLLLQYGADIHARDNKGRTPFMVATEDKIRPIMQLLLENGAEDHRK